MLSHQKNHAHVNCKKVRVYLQKVVLHLRLNQLYTIVCVYVSFVHHIDKYHNQKDENENVWNLKPVKCYKTPAFKHDDEFKLHGEPRTRQHLIHLFLTQPLPSLGKYLVASSVPATIKKIETCN